MQRLYLRRRDKQLLGSERHFLIGLAVLAITGHLMQLAFFLDQLAINHVLFVSQHKHLFL